MEPIRIQTGLPILSPDRIIFFMHTVFPDNGLPPEYTLP